MDHIESIAAKQRTAIRFAGIFKLPGTFIIDRPHRARAMNLGKIGTAGGHAPDVFMTGCELALHFHFFGKSCALRLPTKGGNDLLPVTADDTLDGMSWKNLAKPREDESVRRRRRTIERMLHAPQIGYRFSQKACTYG